MHLRKLVSCIPLKVEITIIKLAKCLILVQLECIPPAIFGRDLICQAEAEMGKTSAFVIATLQQLQPIDGQTSVLVICSTREKASQTAEEYKRLAKFMSDIKVYPCCYYPQSKKITQVASFVGGRPIERDEGELALKCPHIAVGTPARIRALIETGALKTDTVKHFVLDDCDEMVRNIGEDWLGKWIDAYFLESWRSMEVIMDSTPKSYQVIVTSTNSPKQLRKFCKKWMRKDVCRLEFTAQWKAYSHRAIHIVYSGDVDKLELRIQRLQLWIVFRNLVSECFLISLECIYKFARSNDLTRWTKIWNTWNFFLCSSVNNTPCLIREYTLIIDKANAKWLIIVS